MILRLTIGILFAAVISLTAYALDIEPLSIGRVDLVLGMDKDKVVKLLQRDYKLDPIDDSTESFTIRPKSYSFPITPISYGQLIFLDNKLALATKDWGSYSKHESNDAFAALFSALEGLGTNSSKKAVIKTITSRTPNVKAYGIEVTIDGRIINVSNVALPSMDAQTIISETIISESLRKKWETNRSINE